MKKIFLLSLFAFATPIIFAQVLKLANPKEETITASYLLTFARLPRTDELNYWKGQPDQTLKQHIENRRNWMVNNDKKELEGAIRSSYASIFGRVPKPEELNYWMSQKYVFSELLGFQTDFLKSNKAEWESVIKQSYVVAFNKYLKNTDQEFTYWYSQPAIPFSELVKKQLEFKRKNGYKVQSTVNLPVFSYTDLNKMPFVSVPFSYVLRQEMAKTLPKSYIAAVIANDGASVIANDGASVISTGGGNVISTGGGNVISLGNGNVISTGGLNLKQ